MLDPWTLRVLVEVARRGSFSAAARALSMTQPAVSRQIAGLEKRVGVSLFQRVPRGVRSTAAGAAAVDLADEILARLKAMEVHLTAYATLDTGQLRLTAFPSVNSSFVPAAIRRFRAAYPGVSVSLTHPDPAGPLAAVRAGRTDIALLTAWDLAAPVDGIELHRLLDDELLVALPVGHRLAGRKRVRLRDLRDETWIEGGHPDCLGPAPQLADGLGSAPQIGFVCDDWNSKQALVAAGVGIALVAASAMMAIRTDVAVRRTHPELPTRTLYAAAVAQPFQTPPVAAMLKMFAMRTKQLDTSEFPAVLRVHE
ncbi:LysR family transcriptional regulator [Fodinicola feengrottensis]|uniref:LysR family transcriptional regulator n=1 Tax=Fodinicola feengrottensis TaxID=435914 RepID=A0ABN2HLF5_9ACTN|nr:LysR family transcriptional regulator [Fodinicola feengrottensis]